MIKNKGTGAGGNKTNINGVVLENRVRSIISSWVTSKRLISKKRKYKYEHKFNIEEVVIKGNTYIRAPETAFPRWRQELGEGNIDTIKPLHGTKWPDDCLISTKTINWIECKCQQTYGSTGEKLQTPRNKIRNLKWRFPNWEINYLYILDHKFKDLCPQEISDLEFDSIPYIFDNEQDFEQKLLNMIK
jgi:hypothetical protein